MPRFRIIVEIEASCMEAAQAVAWELAGGQVGNPCEIKRLWDLETKGGPHGEDKQQDTIKAEN